MSSQYGLGSRAWVNPFTGVFPRGDSPTPPQRPHGHTHTGTSHRVTVAMSDLDTTQNAGATYFGEGQYVTPHEYAWCQAHPGQCNMYNNVSYRQFTCYFGGPTNFTFSAVGSTVRMQPAIMAWTGATINQIEPDPGNDGIGFVGYKVTNPTPPESGITSTRFITRTSIARFNPSVCLWAPGVNISNIGFHAPPQEPGWANDGTVGNAGLQQHRLDSHSD